MDAFTTPADLMETLHASVHTEAELIEALGTTPDAIPSTAALNISVSIGCDVFRVDFAIDSSDLSKSADPVVEAARAHRRTIYMSQLLFLSINVLALSKIQGSADRAIQVSS